MLKKEKSGLGWWHGSPLQSDTSKRKQIKEWKQKSQSTYICVESNAVEHVGRSGRHDWSTTKYKSWVLGGGREGGHHPAPPASALFHVISFCGKLNSFRFINNNNSIVSTYISERRTRTRTSSPHITHHPFTKSDGQKQTQQLALSYNYNKNINTVYFSCLLAL